LIRGLFFPLTGSPFEESALIFYIDPIICVWEVGLHSGDGWPVGTEIRIDRNEILLVVGHIFLCIDGIDGALWNAHGTVDAFIGVDY
jgi:hypothetical protein